MKELNINPIDSLYDEYIRNCPPKPVFSKKQWYLSKQNMPKLAMDKIIIANHDQINHDFSIVFININNDSYCVVISNRPIEYDSQLMLKESEYRSLIVLRLLRQGIMPYREPFPVTKMIDLFDDSDTESLRIEVDQLLEFYQPIHIYKFVPRYTGSESEKYAEVLNLILSCRLYRLPFSEEVLYRFQELALSDILSIPFENILNAILAIQPKYVFLDLYRTVEYAWQDTFDNMLKTRISCSQSIDDIFTDFQIQRPRERNVLEVLFEKLNVRIKQYTPLIMRMETNSKIANWYYNIRNSIAHGKRKGGIPSAGRDATVPGSSQEWNNLFNFTLGLIMDIFSLK